MVANREQRRHPERQTEQDSHHWLKYLGASAYAGISERALRDAVAARKVTSARLGQARVFKTEWLDEWIESSTDRAQR